jgi:hypothetical protein
MNDAGERRHTAEKMNNSLSLTHTHTRELLEQKTREFGAAKGSDFWRLLLLLLYEKYRENGALGG